MFKESVLYRNKSETPASQHKLYGTFFGVYLPGVLSMFGVVIYLRFAWVLGTLGLTETLSVVALSCFILFLTVLSISSGATNMHVGGGGTYYMVSRSLGIEMGAAIGIPLFLAQSLSIAFCSMGFAESIHPFFPQVPLHFLGAATVILLMIVVLISSDIVINTQLLVFLVIVASLVSLFLGKNLCLEHACNAGKTPFSNSFWMGFALFFPATTGVESGVSMSGNLRSPRRSLPIGTIAVLITGFLVYMAIPLFMWKHAPRDLLISDPLIFQHIAKYKFLITLGIWAAALSSVISALLAAPRTLQALAQDGIFPKVLAKEWGKNREPRMATLACFLLALLAVFYGSVNKIAPILTMFYLIAYTTLNLATGLEDLLGNPSWRPTFKVPWPISFLGVFLCLLAMFMIAPGYTFIAMAFVVLVYMTMSKRNLRNKWEDIRFGLLLFLSRYAIYKLANQMVLPRSWRPHFLIFSNNPTQNDHLIDAASLMSQGKGFLTVATIFTSNLIDNERIERWKKLVMSHLKKKKVEALVEFSIHDTLAGGAKQLLATYGVGLVSPNTLVLGTNKKRETIHEYLTMVKEACLTKKNVIIIDEPRPVGVEAKKIDIWWDDTCRINSELMLLLSHMLKTTKAHKKTELRLNAIVSNELGKSQRLQYFHDFFAKSRFVIRPHVYIKEKEDSPWKIMAEISSHSEAVFIGMQGPRGDQSDEEYEKYYFNVLNGASAIPNKLFVIGREEINFREIFN